MQCRCVSIRARSEHRPRPAFLVIAIPLLRIAFHCSAPLLRGFALLARLCPASPLLFTAIPSPSMRITAVPSPTKRRLPFAMLIYAFHRRRSQTNAFPRQYASIRFVSVCASQQITAIPFLCLSLLFRRAPRLAYPLHIIENHYFANPYRGRLCSSAATPVLAYPLLYSRYDAFPVRSHAPCCHSVASPVGSAPNYPFP